MSSYPPKLTELIEDFQSITDRTERAEALIEIADRTVKFYFDVLNPQGLSAMAMSVVLDEAYSNQPLDYAAALDTELVFKLFGREISMGKGQGLMGIVAMVRDAAQKRLRKPE